MAGSGGMSPPCNYSVVTKLCPVEARWSRGRAQEACENISGPMTGIDLHAHTVYSDGTYPPRRTISLARERRLDAVVYRIGLGMSRRQARQLVRHGHVAVNGRKVNIPSYQVSVGEEISIRENSRKLALLEQAKEFAAHQNAPGWLEIDRDNFKGKVLALPKREDIHLPVNEQLIVELYSK